MLRTKVCFLTVAVLLIAILVFIPSRASSNSNVVRLTNSSQQGMSLNPSLSDDSRVVVFETSANFFSAAPSDGFHAIHADVVGDPPVLVDLAKTRIISPALSADGSAVVFASAEDLVGENSDRNSEIFLLTGAGLRQ